MTELHDKMGELSYVLRNSNGELPKYWLQYFRDWLRGKKPHAKSFKSTAVAKIYRFLVLKLL